MTHTVYWIAGIIIAFVAGWITGRIWLVIQEHIRFTNYWNGH